ncbi:MAG: outer membrane beta-barrel protein [Methylocystis sp.]
MKKISILATSAVLLASAVTLASAADLPSREAPPPDVPPPPAWTGFYFGVNGGYTWTGSNTINQTYADTWAGGFATHAALGDIPSQVSVGSSGFLGGGQVGFNWQFSNNFVIGAEADIQGLTGGTKTANVLSGNSATSFSRGLSELGTVRARVGFLATPILLIYATGGLAYGQADLTGNYYGAWSPVLQLIDNQSQTGVGYAVGGGVEWLFAKNWSAKAEYLYYDLGSVTTTGVQYSYKSPAGVAQISTAQSSSSFNGHVVRVGLNYHVNWGAPAPIAAKY